MKSVLIAMSLAAALFDAAHADGAMPPAACPEAAAQLPELLASAMRRVGHDGLVSVEFEVDARGHARPLTVEGSRSYRAPVRTAIDALDCRAGTPKRYVLDIRFAEPVPGAALAAEAASATLAQAQSR